LNTVDTATIFALSSGGLPSGVAVVRLSGPQCLTILSQLTGKTPTPGLVKVGNICDPADGSLIDHGLFLYFAAPRSFTGEDCAEFQIHGGQAVVAKLLSVLSAQPGLRLAEEGEFSRRAFENGKLDLTEIEGLSDLLAAETEAQRRQAAAHADGHFRRKLENWRERLVECRAYLEAEFDFSDEDDVPDSMRDHIHSVCSSLLADLSDGLEDANAGEIIRFGFKVALLGPPNSGKSSLLNALAGRDMAITSSIAGTTRDILECKIDIAGVPVVLLDTAGIRESGDEIEQEGIRRALYSADEADLVLWLSPVDSPADPPSNLPNAKVVHSKSDVDLPVAGSDLAINTMHDDGLSELVFFLKNVVDGYVGSNVPLVTRERHRVQLLLCSQHLSNGLDLIHENGVLAAEELRLAGDCLGRLTGKVDVEDLLDVIFSKFCVGK